ncbi:unnamed protein product [Symbiodinium sp. CCMP2592]|nr:unnamed protein product [Symbiodinium sp. CCMP2592]
MVLSKMAMKVMKKPAAAKSTKTKKVKEEEDEAITKKGSMNDSIKRMKSSAALCIEDGKADHDMEGEEEEEEGGDESTSRDKGFALKFQKMKKDLPAYVVDLVETQSAKAAHPREFKSKIINKLFKRESWLRDYVMSTDKSGKIHLNLQDACFKEHKKLYNENFSKSSEISYPESIFKGMFYANNDDKFEAALAKGEICEAKSSVPGVKFFSFQTFKAVQKTGCMEEEELSSTAKVSKDQAKILSECFSRIGWKMKHSTDETKKFAKGGSVPTNIEAVLRTALEAQQKLSKDAMIILKKWGADDDTTKNLRKYHKGSQEFIVKLDHIKQFRELPDDEALTKPNFDKFLLKVADHTEQFNVLVESSKGALKAKINCGLRQRLQRSREEKNQTSDLAAYLVEECLWGSMSPQQVQKIAALSCRDAARARETGDMPGELETLAKLGASGLYPNKCWADLTRQLAPSIKVPPAVLHKVPTKAGLDTLPVLMPHELLASIYDTFPAVWVKVVKPSDSRAEQFWRSVKGHPALESSPLLARPNYQRLCIPLGVHGDAVPITGLGKAWCQQLTDLSFMSLLGLGSVKELLFYMGGFWEKLRVMSNDMNGTAHKFLAVLAWSFQILWEGVWPSADFSGKQYPAGSQEARKAGQPLMGGHFAFLFSLQGDLDYYASVLDLPRSTLASGPCALCRSTKVGPCSWQDFRTSAAWRATSWKASEWRLWSGKSSCPLLQLPGTSCWAVAFDWLHIKYLGLDQFLYASIIFMLVFYILPGTPEENMQSFWKLLQQQYSDLAVPCRFRYLNRLSMILRKKGSPKLRGKGAEIRHLSRPIFNIWAAKMNPALEIHRKIHLLLKLNANAEQLLTDHRELFALPSRDASVFETSIDGVLMLQHQLQGHFQDEPQKLFNVTEKSHFAQHCGILARHVSPRLLWCFSGEDQQRRVQELTQASVKGNGPGSALIKVATRYRMALHVQFHKIEAKRA